MLKVQMVHLNIQPGQGLPQFSGRSLPIAVGYPRLDNYRPGYGNGLNNSKAPLSSLKKGATSPLEVTTSSK